jgi:hypothetical protein
MTTDYTIGDILTKLINFLGVILEGLTAQGSNLAALAILMIYVSIVPVAIVAVFGIPMLLAAYATKGFGGKVRLPGL